MNERILIKDKASYQDIIKGATPRKTRVILKDHDTGEVLADKENKVLISGSLLNASDAFGISSSEHIPTYNEEMALDNSVEASEMPDNTPIVCLFCVDDSGCGNTPSEVYVVNYTDRIEPDSILPFRYVDATEDLTSDLRQFYFGRKTLTDGSGKIAYYFKGFDSEPQLRLQYADGTQINGEDIYTIETSQQAECYVETRLRINRLDFRDYFEQVLGWDKARISSLSLCWAWYREYEEGSETYKYFQSILPYTKLNFPLNWLVDKTKAIDIIYQIYY